MIQNILNLLSLSDYKVAQESLMITACLPANLTIKTLQKFRQLKVVKGHVQKIGILYTPVNKDCFIGKCTDKQVMRLSTHEISKQLKSYLFSPSAIHPSSEK
jgi:hypothetical protein